MGKIGAYQPTDKYKNYSLPTSKPLRSHSFYKEKVWSVHEQVYNKLKKVAELLQKLYPKLTDAFSANIKGVIEKNLETLLKDLALMEKELEKNPDAFKTSKLKLNQQHITEMKNACATLQTLRSYEYEYKNLGKIKHALHELELLIQPTSFEKSLEKSLVRRKPTPLPSKKAPSRVQSKKKIEKTPIVKSKKPAAPTKAPAKTPAKKSKPAAKTTKPAAKTTKPAAKTTKPASRTTKTAAKSPKQNKVVSKQPKKAATPASHKPKTAVRKIARTKPAVKSSKPSKIVSKQPKKSAKPKLKINTTAKKVTKTQPKLAAKKISKIKSIPKKKATAPIKKK